MTDRQPAQGRARVTNWLYQPDPRIAGNAMALLSGAGDSLPFGLADRASAGVKAAWQASYGADFNRAYDQNMREEKAQDDHDARHYGGMRTAGQVGGTVAQIAALGLGEGAILGGSRIAHAAGLIARERNALGAVGAAGGVVNQAVSDLAHKRLGSPGDYAGAAVGGTAGALASVYGRGSLAGAAGGATTSLAQDLANGRLPSLKRASEAAYQGAVIGGAAGAAGRVASNGLSPTAKGKLGEMMSLPRTWARGDRTLPIGQKRKYLEGGGYTYPDHWLAGDKFVESKFGIGVKDLSKAQNRANIELNSNQPGSYRPDHWLPQDVGAALGAVLAPQGYLNADDSWPPSAPTD
jgi:hypothetical protein